MKKKSSKQKPDPEMIDDINPEWNEEDFAQARPAKEMLRELLPKKVVDRLLRSRGRPKTENPKCLVSLRLSPEVIAHFKSKGAGWQTRIDETLRKAAGL